jgi:glycosyltransferase involved in cell wall biosynthesis
MAKLKVLLAADEPPTNSSGLGTLWAKLSIGISKHLELDVIAPHLETCFATQDNKIGVSGELIAIKYPPLSRRSSININDPAITGVRRLFWLAVRVFVKVFEKFRLIETNKYQNWLYTAIYGELLNPKNVSHYDFYAVHIPSLELAETVYTASKHIGKPLILVIGDPQGHRNGAEFVPAKRTLQQQMIRDCSALLISEATYNNYYQKCFEIDSAKVVFFSDCYLAAPDSIKTINRRSRTRLLHWGAIAEYRNPSSLIDAIKAINCNAKGKIVLTIAGPIFSKPQKRYAIRELSNNLKIDIPTSYTYAKNMIAEADVYIVIVSKRHLDNIPSKLVEGLSFKRPMLVLANTNSATAKFVRRNGIGIVVTSDSTDEIINAIKQITENYNDYVAAFNSEEISNYEVNAVGNKVGADLKQVLLSEH